MVIDHINYAATDAEGDHTLIAGDDLIQSDVILGSKKIEVGTNTSKKTHVFQPFCSLIFLYIYYFLVIYCSWS